MFPPWRVREGRSALLSRLRRTRRFHSFRGRSRAFRPSLNTMKNTLAASFGLCLLLSACGGEAPDADMPEGMDMSISDAPIGTVTILEPANGAAVMGTSLTVRLSVAGFPIVVAGDMTPGTGHHHLYLDADVADVTVPVPAVPGSIVHMGNAASEFTFENVTPGQHRLIAVVADGAHVPLHPLVVDTVMFSVR